MELADAINTLPKFCGPDLTRTLSRIEMMLQGANRESCDAALANNGVESEVLTGAGLIKGSVGQIHVAIHALGILLCLPHLLE